MEPRIGSNATQSCYTVFLVALVEDRTADVGEVELKFFGKNVLDQRLDCDIVGTTDGGKVRIGTGSFRDELLVS